MRPQPLFATLRRKWRSLQRQSWQSLALLVPAWALLGLASLVLRAVSLKRLARFYGRDLGIGVWLPLISPEQEARARHIRTSIGIASRYSPWRADCYRQALCARVLLGLGRVPHVLCFGLRRRNGVAEAHAWVMAWRVPVCGRDSFASYTLVRAFSTAPDHWTGTC